MAGSGRLRPASSAPPPVPLLLFVLQSPLDAAAGAGGAASDAAKGAAGAAKGVTPGDPGSAASGDWLFAPPGDILKVIALSAAAFLAVAVLFRLAGTRAAGQMNNFDWIVTVAQGAIVGSVALGANTSLAEGTAAVLTLLGFQYALNWAGVRSERLRKTVYTSPVLLYHGGFLRETMKKERVTEGEVRGAVRAAGMPDWDDVGAVVLEPGGEFSVLPKADGDDGAAGGGPDPAVLEGVAGAD